MKKEPIFRKTTKEEEKFILHSIEKDFGASSISPFARLELWIKEGIVREIFAVNKEISDFLKKLQTNIYFAGIPIGSLFNEKFFLEIEGAKLINSFTKNKVYVKTEQFLYGKPIFIENIVKSEYSFQKGDTVLIYGKNNLHYGLGKVNINYEDLTTSQANTILIKGNKNRPFDRGWYLRKGN
ncbi:MAG: NIP7 pre-PUA domain-containing protein [Candidatus Heimdallarchaeaceae archaeon]